MEPSEVCAELRDLPPLPYNRYMGLYDRDYYREERPAFSITAPRSAVAILIILNVLVWIADSFTPGQYADKNARVLLGRWLSDHLAIGGDTLTRPWLWWQFLAYGFAHSPVNFWHILGNMLGLFFFGRDIEWHYGRSEFVRLYLAMLAAGGLVWAVANAAMGLANPPLLYGASGAVTGVIILFALNYPHRTVLLFFFLPAPAWVLGVFLIVHNVLGTFNQTGSNVAFSVHLVGAAFAYLYFRLGWNLGRLTPAGFRLRLPRAARRPRLRVHDPDADADFDPDADADSAPSPDDELTEEVDRILAKIHRQGEASLTRKERRTLETASREYQRRRQQQPR